MACQHAGGATASDEEDASCLEPHRVEKRHVVQITHALLAFTVITKGVINII